MSKPTTSKSVSQQLVSGAVSGFSSTVFLQPFDLIKTRLQQRDGAAVQRNTSAIMRATKDVVRENGMLGLWRGTGVSLVRNVPGVALYMTVLTQLRSQVASRTLRVSDRDATTTSVLPKLTNSANLLTGATARVSVGFLLNPFSVLKARYESNMYAYSSLGNAVAQIVRMGPSELLRGFLASSLRDAPYAGLFVVFYEGIKWEAGHALSGSGNASLSAMIHSGSAASASALATLATHPFDVVKTKVQVRTEARYAGLSKTVHTIWIQRGINGFFDGLSLRMGRKVLSSAIGWAAYEALVGILGRRP